MRVLIVGGGVMGLCTAWALRRAGHAPVVLERGDLPDPRASSFDEHRAIRFAYGGAHGYARMVAEAFASWERLWRDLGERHYVATGLLVIGECHDPWILGSRTSLLRLGLPFDEPAPEALARRHPMLDAARLPYVLHTPAGGVLLARRILLALVRWLEGGGVELRPRSEVAALEPERAAVRLADGTRESADALVVTAGAWTGRLVPSLARVLVPSRQVVAYVEPPVELAGAWAEAPTLVDVDSAASRVFYALPPVAGTGLKFGDHRFGPAGDPDADRTVRPDEIAAIMALAGRRLPGAAGWRVREARSCFYTVAPDERFVAERFGRTLVLSACSGHGFKFAACIGERAAACIAGGADLEAFRRWLAGDEAAA
jgi:glycine/D-amino acid oxidase-like deaminating enzyme